MEQLQGEQSWKELYEAALFELNSKLLAQKIADAQKAIGERALALVRANGDDNSEKELLAGARVVLDDLKRIYQINGRVA